jgi:hypothetical protein
MDFDTLEDGLIDFDCEALGERELDGEIDFELEAEGLIDLEFELDGDLDDDGETLADSCRASFVL